MISWPALKEILKGPMMALALCAFTPLVGSAQDVGREAAQRYFGAGSKPAVRETASVDSAQRYLQVHLGSFVSDRAYRWGGDLERDVGGFQAGFTYRLGEWVGTADLNLRVDYLSYQLEQGEARKLAFLMMFSLPDSMSYFPLYFGLGLGPGVFLRQIPERSSLSLDYQLVVGLRFFNVLGSTGFFFESGIKDHFHLLSSGQVAEGLFVTAGPVFTF